jgi:hypothetical protein
MMEPANWRFDFLFTLVVETPVYALALRRSLGTGGAIAASLALNVATHPLAWHVIRAADRPFPGVYLGVELAVILAEAAMIVVATRARWSRFRLPVRECAAIALAANAFSAGLALFV